MLYKEFYDSIENPLERKGILDKVIDLYSNSSVSIFSSYNSFYSKLSKTNIEDKEIGVYNKEAEVALYEEEYKQWKKGLVKLAQKTNDESVRALAKFAVKDKATTIFELEENVRKKDRSLLSVVQKYSHITDSFSWDQHYSNKVQLDDSYYGPIEHRLYLNCDSSIVPMIALKLIKKARENNMGYLFKYNSPASRSDTFVVYSSTADVPLYAKWLKEIKRELITENGISPKAFHEPPLLTGAIDGWIGYGSEPSKEDPLDKDERSYNCKRSIQLCECISSVYAGWLRDLKHQQVSADGKSMTYAEFFAQDLVYLYREREEERAKKWKTKVLQTEESYKVLEKEILKNYDEILKYIVEINNGKDIDGDDCIKITIPLKKGTETLSNTTIVNLAREHLKLLSAHFPDFKEDVLESIKSSNKKIWNITDNYAVDKNALLQLQYYEKLVREVDQKRQAKKQPVVTKPVNKEPVVKTQTISVTPEPSKKTVVTPVVPVTPVPSKKTVVTPVSEPVTKQQSDKPKVLVKQRNVKYKPMTQAEIDEARKRYGF